MTADTSDPATAAAAARAQKAAVWEDFIDVFYAPAEVFTRRATGAPWLPLLLLTVIMGVLGFLNAGLLEPIMTAEFDRSIAATVRSNPAITAEQVDAMRRVSARIAQFAGLFVPVGVLAMGVGSPGTELEFAL